MCAATGAVKVIAIDVTRIVAIIIAIVWFFRNCIWFSPISKNKMLLLACPMMFFVYKGEWKVPTDNS